MAFCSAMRLPRLLRALVALLLCWAALPALAELLELKTAQVRIHADGVAQDGPVALPYNWDRHQRGAQGEATFEFVFDLAHVPVEPYGLLMYRVGNAYEVWLNGALLKHEGDMERPHGADFAKEPRYVVMPQQLLARQNRLTVHIRADSGRRAGLAQVLLGPEGELNPRYRRSLTEYITGSLAVGLVGLVVGGIALLLWLTQPSVASIHTDNVVPSGRDSLYLFAGLAEWSWSLRVSDQLMEHPPLPWPQWNGLMVLASAAWMCCVMMFCFRVANWQQSRAARALGLAQWALFAVAWGVGALAVAWHRPGVVTLWYGLCLLVFIPFCGLFTAAALRRGANREHRLLAVALLLNVIVGIRDWIVFRFGEAYGDATWLRYSGLMFGCMLTYVAITRFSAASARARELSASLSARVAQKETELRQSYQQVEQLAREQERTRERTRILRDMHDGVGAHIGAAIRQLQSGKASRDEVLLTLRDSLDQLKLSIDAMHLPAGDVTGLLANLRFRLAPRLASAGIELQWHVDLLDPVQRLDGSAMRQLQFMLFEVLSNVLQHAHASLLRIEARGAQDGAVLRVMDNGRGFDTTQPARKGLLSLNERAHAIGARLTLHSGAQGTEVIIVLPG